MNEQNYDATDLSRRRFLKGAAAGLATAAGMDVVTPKPTLAQTPLSTASALQELMDGNKRFASERLTA